MARRHYTSTELLELAGCTRKTLRVLEQRGLIAPARETGRERYDAYALRRLWLLLELRALGFSLDQLGELLDAREGHDNAGAAARTLDERVDGIVKRIHSRMRDMEILRETLLVARDTLQDCSACNRHLDDCRGCASAGRLDVASAVLLAGAAGKRGPRGA